MIFTGCCSFYPGDVFVRGYPFGVGLKATIAQEHRPFGGTPILTQTLILAGIASFVLSSGAGKPKAMSG